MAYPDDAAGYQRTAALRAADPGPARAAVAQTMFDRGVNLPGPEDYDVEPLTGFTYSTNPTAQWARTEAPRLVGPPLALPPEHVMRDPSLPTTWPMTGGTPIEVSGFRSLLRPWGGRG